MAEIFYSTVQNHPTATGLGTVELLPLFLDDVRGRGRSPNTVETYRWHLGKYLEFLAAEGVAVDSVSENDIREFMDARRSMGLKSSSRYITMVAIRQFHVFLRRSGRCPRNPARRISMPTPDNRIPQVLDLQEVRRLLRALRGGRFRNLRTRAMLSLFYATGIRLKELCGLQESDLDLSSCVVHVVGKGGKERTVPFLQGLIDILRRYLDEKNRRFPENGHLFVSRKGHALCRSGIQRDIKDVARRAGISKPVSPVILRHTFATHLMWGGADLRSIQSLLGHADLGTTAIYTQLDPGRVWKTYGRAHPLSNGRVGVRHG